MGVAYFHLGELERAREYYAKAFELREHASEREKLLIAADYYFNVTGQLDKAAQTYQEILDSYPRDLVARSALGVIYASRGQYDKAAETTRQEQQLGEAASVVPYVNLANDLLALQRFDEARQVIQEAHTRKLDDYILHLQLYAVAFLASNSPTMAEQQQWFASNPGVENLGLSLASDTEAYAGQLGKARELTRRSVDSAIRADSKETGAIWWENAALK